METRYVDYEEFDCLMEMLALKIKLSKIELTHILALGRGGLIPGVVLSHKLGLPMKTVFYSSSDGKGSGGKDITEAHRVMKEGFQPKDSILVVDDLVDSGHSLKDVVEYLHSEFGHTPYSAVIFEKEGSVISPTFNADVVTKDSPFIDFPWECP